MALSFLAHVMEMKQNIGLFSQTTYTFHDLNSPRFVCCAVECQLRMHRITKSTLDPWVQKMVQKISFALALLIMGGGGGGGGLLLIGEPNIY